jgi:CHASE2 domain-containing sensor protein
MWSNANIKKIVREYYPGVLVIVGVGVLLVALPLGNSLARLSYDLPFLYRAFAPIAQTNIVLVYADQSSLDELGRMDDGTLDRSAHTRLLERLTDGEAKLVLYDFLFLSSNKVARVDEELARAIRRNGRVVLGATFDRFRQGNQFLERAHPPIPLLREASLDRGLFTFEPIDPDNAVRELCAQISYYTNAVWVAARFLKPSVAFEPAKTAQKKWLNYYGPARATVFEARAFQQALEPDGVPHDFFRGKIVFVGGRSVVGPIGALKDEYANPYSRFGLQESPGLEVHATALANLINKDRDWLVRMKTSLQILLVAIWGFVISIGLLFMRRRHAIWITPGSMALISASSVYLQLQQNVWWSWMVPVAVQTPLALLWFVLANPRPIGPTVAFISYRRQGGAETARLIRAALRERRQNVFLDVEDLGPGIFDARLLEEIEHAPNFIVILSPGSLDQGHGKDDWLLKEIGHAIQARRNVIPILKDGFVLPAHESLPPEVADLPRFNGVIYSHLRFDDAIDELVDFLKK